MKGKRFQLNHYLLF